MVTASSQGDFFPEHQLFWMLVNKARKRGDVGRVYLAVQAALAYHRETVDVGWLEGAMMAEGRHAMDADCDRLGADGLAFFYWLYETELTAAGNGDCHHYLFRRRYDGAQVTAYLKTAHHPKSLHFQQEYERTKRALEKKRATLLANYRWLSTPELFERYSAAVQAKCPDVGQAVYPPSTRAATS